MIITTYVCDRCGAGYDEDVLHRVDNAFGPDPFVCDECYEEYKQVLNEFFRNRMPTEKEAIRKSRIRSGVP